MRQLMGFLVALALCSCGDEEKTSTQRLRGSWIAEDSVDLCAIVVSFDGEGYIEFKEICELTDGSLAIVIDSGFYESNDTTFTWHAEASSCADTDGEPETVRYNLDGDRLTLIWPDGVIAFERAKPTGGSGGVIAEFGCFDDEGFFEPRPVQPI